MADNGKKEFPIKGYEQDCISKVGRRIYCYIINGKGVTKKAKRAMNKRFRKRWKQNKTI